MNSEDFDISELQRTDIELLKREAVIPLFHLHIFIHHPFSPSVDNSMEEIQWFPEASSEPLAAAQECM